MRFYHIFLAFLCFQAFLTNFFTKNMCFYYTFLAFLHDFLGFFRNSLEKCVKLNNFQQFFWKFWKIIFVIFENPKIPMILSKILPNAVELCQMSSNTIKSCQMFCQKLSNAVKHCEILPIVVRCCQISCQALSNPVIHCQIWSNSVQYNSKATPSSIPINW